MDALSPGTISLMIGAVGTAVIGVRSLALYKREARPLNFYYAQTGFLFTVALLMNVLPLLVNPHGRLLDVSAIVADAFMLWALLLQINILWYLLLQRFIAKRGWFIGPFILVGVTAWVLSIIHTVNSTSVVITNGQVFNAMPSYSLTIWAVMYAMMVPLGIYYLLQAEQRTDTGGKLRATAIGIVYITAGAGAAYNHLYNMGQIGEVTQRLYLIAFVVLLVSSGAIFIRQRSADQS